MQFTFITGNAHKAKYVAQWLGADVPHHRLDLDEIQTLDLHELVTHKAKQAYDALKTPVLVEDAQLALTALGGLPGPFIKWFLDAMGIDGLASLIQKYDDRSAHGSICYALYDGQTMHFFEGEMHGQIASEPRGTGGFGFDQIFINDGFTKTRAEMTEEEYANSSYRKQALDTLKEFLDGQA
ncbi:MAG TPA: non-canonical purine NTP pyrophosphatase [Magnetospirillaceae bacterium]|nr:non-canonical purine NTP pyrophosphatase [Magnetospirillaceae bacterium]